MTAGSIRRCVSVASSLIICWRNIMGKCKAVVLRLTGRCFVWLFVIGWLLAEVESRNNIYLYLRLCGRSCEAGRAVCVVQVGTFYLYVMVVSLSFLRNFSFLFPPRTIRCFLVVCVCLQGCSFRSFVSSLLRSSARDAFLLQSLPLKDETGEQLACFYGGGLVIPPSL